MGTEVEYGVSLPGQPSANAMLLSAEVRHRPNDSKTSFGLGTEYAVLPMVSLRGGFLSRMESAPSGASPLGANGLGLGIGINMKPGSFDYSFSPYGELGSEQRLSFTSRF